MPQALTRMAVGSNVPPPEHSRNMYIMRLKNCAFFAHHGVFAEEEALGQRFYVDAELQVRSSEAVDLDLVEGTVDYAAVFLEIETLVSGRRRFLIEALAFDIAKALCLRFEQIESACVTVRKPNAPVRGVLDYVEVTVVWPPPCSGGL